MGEANKERLSVTIPVKLLEQIRKLAAEDNRNLSNMVTVLLKDATARKNKAA